jgi:uncharacterized protein (TIGR02145 family)
MTNAQKNAIVAPVAGSMLWCTDCTNFGILQVYNGTEWTNMDGTRNCGAYTTAGPWKQFMCHNLGVNTALSPFNYADGAINGDLYQWGRPADGHQSRTPLSGSVNTQATNNNATAPSTVIAKFILGFNDWRSQETNTLWGDGTSGANTVKAVNDPCPLGFKVPSQAQWGSIFTGGTASGAPATATANLWTWTGNGYTVGSSLYLPAAGTRSSGLTILGLGLIGNYWSSTVNGSLAYSLTFNSGDVNPGANYIRRLGFSVRCISE